MDPQEAYILLIEDERIIYDMYLFKFTLLGLHLLIAKTFEEGREALTKYKPDLVLLDLSLDDRKDGFEILKEMKAHDATKHIPVYVLSNLREQANKEKSEALGAAGFISKIDTKPGWVARIVIDALLKMPGKS
jgi:DNA-binding response OmpR family regulator